MVAIVSFVLGLTAYWAWGRFAMRGVRRILRTNQSDDIRKKLFARMGQQSLVRIRNALEAELKERRES